MKSDKSVISSLLKADGVKSCCRTVKRAWNRPITRQHPAKSFRNSVLRNSACQHTYTHNTRNTYIYICIQTCIHKYRCIRAYVPTHACYLGCLPHRRRRRCRCREGFAVGAVCIYFHIYTYVHMYIDKERHIRIYTLHYTHAGIPD
jgi:hypothetical protein